MCRHTRIHKGKDAEHAQTEGLIICLVKMSNMAKASMLASIIAVQLAMVGSPQNPELWAVFRDLLGLPWNENQLGREMVLLALFVDVLIVFSTCLHSFKSATPASSLGRRRSLRSRTSLWFCQKFMMFAHPKVQVPRRSEEAQFITKPKDLLENEYVTDYNVCTELPVV